MKNKILVLLLTAVTATSMVQAHFGDGQPGLGAFVINTAEAPFDTTAALVHEGAYVYPDEYRYNRHDKYRYDQYDQNDSRQSTRDMQQEIDQIRKQARKERRKLSKDEQTRINRIKNKMDRR